MEQEIKVNVQRNTKVIKVSDNIIVIADENLFKKYPMVTFKDLGNYTVLGTFASEDEIIYKLFLLNGKVVTKNKKLK